MSNPHTWSVTIDVGTPNEKTVTMTLDQFRAYCAERAAIAKSIFSHSIREMLK